MKRDTFQEVNRKFIDKRRIIFNCSFCFFTILECPTGGGGGSGRGRGGFGGGRGMYHHLVLFIKCV